MLFLTQTHSLRLSQFISGSSEGWRVIAGIPGVALIGENGTTVHVNASTSPSFLMAPNELLLDIVNRTSAEQSSEMFLRLFLSFPTECAAEQCISRLVIIGETCSLDTLLFPGENAVRLWPFKIGVWSLCSALLQPDHLCEYNDPENASAQVLRSLRFLLISFESPRTATTLTFFMSSAELQPASPPCPANVEGPCDGRLSAHSTIADWLLLSDFEPLRPCTEPPIQQPGPGAARTLIQTTTAERSALAARGRSRGGDARAHGVAATERAQAVRGRRAALLTRTLWRHPARPPPPLRYRRSPLFPTSRLPVP